jgi:hypothetical protein
MREKEFISFVKLNFLEQILMLQKEDYLEPDHEICGEEKVIGEMNNFEKVAYTLFMEKYNSLKEFIIDENGNLRDSDFLISRSANLGSRFILNKKIEFRQMTLFRNLLWASLEERFLSIDNLTIGIRNGFQVVNNVATDEKSNYDKCPVKNICREKNHGIDNGTFSLN